MNSTPTMIPDRGRHRRMASLASPASPVLVCLAFFSAAWMWAAVSPAVVAAPPPPTQDETRVTFRLVPEAYWNDGQPDRSQILPTGKIFLYRAGSYAPEIVGVPNEPQVVSPGRWLWVAEGENRKGDDFVSLVSGKIHFPEGADPYDKALLGPVVPACEVRLDPAADWKGVDRLDAVSLDRPAVYPVIVQERERFLVPEGRFLAYTVGSEGVTAISAVEICADGEPVELSPPRPAKASRQDLMVSLQLPPESDLDLRDQREELDVELRPFADSSPLGSQPPDAALWTRQRATFFFLGANARAPLVLDVRHPDFFPYDQEISPLPGGVRELADVELRPRPSR